MAAGASKELPPLTDLQEPILLSEVRLQCEFILIAQTQLAIAEAATWHEHVETYGWYAIQAMLTAAGNLSKLVGGKKGREARQRRSIRAHLGITSASVLHQRAIRDATEHFDSRLLDVSAGKKIWAARMFGYPMREIEGVTPEDAIFHDYNPKTGVLTFAEHSLSLREVVAEARRIDALITAMKDPNTLSPREL